MRSDTGLKRSRTVGLTLLLAVVIAMVIVLVCAVIGTVGAGLAACGLFTIEEMTSPVAIIFAIAIGSFAITAMLCVWIGLTLVQPLRLMTQAMGHLASGDFSSRIESGGRFSLKEVRDFAESYNVAARELASIEMMREGFISDFSHELRTPINSMAGFAQLLLEDDLPEEERRDYLSVIHKESIRLAGLSERILALSKIEAASILPDIEPVDISEQLRRTAILFDGRLKEKGLQLSLSLDECIVYGNADYLTQLWTNLIDNAVKYSPEGGCVSVALYGGGREGDTYSEAVAWISDEGCGMDGTTQARIFDRFYQGDSSRASAGSGLGLALCKRIVELHGGTISAQSALGEGSTFEVRLPAAVIAPRAWGAR